MRKNGILIILIFLILTITSLHAENTAKISGVVVDSLTDHALPGANIWIKDTGYGTASDLKGSFVLTGLPAGSFTLVVQYISYIEKEYPITLSEGQSLKIMCQLEYQVVEGEVIEITAQVEGQVQAINQQIMADNVKNIVSSAKIQELPEANAAEAVGRLPGVSLQREGGEGNKVVIRGLSPQFSKIQVNGISMAASDSNRSVDLSMISPAMLDGIEVSKTAMADEEADRLGGTVNFILKSADNEPKFNASAQYGYNSLSGEFNNYNYILSGSRRFFTQKFGIFAQGNFERRDRSDNNVYAGYQMLHDTLTLTNSVGFQDINRTNKRLGGTIVLDYNQPSTQVKFSTMYSKIDVNTEHRQEHLDGVGRTHSYNGVYNEKNISVLVSSIQLNQLIKNISLTSNLSYSKSKTDIPEELRIIGVENNAFNQNWTFDDYPLDPEVFSLKAVNDTSNIVLSWFTQRDYSTIEEEISGDLSFEWNHDLKYAQLKFKFGGKYKHKYKKYDNNENRIPMGWNDLDLLRTYLADEFNLTNYDVAQDFPYAPFIDKNYNPSDFMAGDYDISRIPDIDLLKKYYHAIEGLKTVRGQTIGKTIYKDYNASILNDYNGNEDYYAAYIMPTVYMFNSFTFIPGFRYEKNITKYSGQRVNSPGRWSDPFPYKTVSAERDNEFILPMIHVKYKPSEWFDIRASYNKTLSRPSYIRIIPSWTAWEDNLTWNNTALKPAESKNLDLFLSIYSDKIGLFTVGVFQKRIKNFIYNTTTWIADTTNLRDEWPESVSIGGKVYGFINNPNEAKLLGFETEWQSNFWFLPGVLKGLVLSANYTYTHSDLRYPRTIAKWDTIQIGPIQVPRISGTADGSYNARLLDQPTHIFNISAGFDYKGFSIRSSVQFRSDVFSSNNWYSQLRQSSEPLTLYDMKIKQHLPVKGLQLYCNINNFSKALEQFTNNGTKWFTSKSYYGITADMGLRYDF